ncbi:HlyD family type I secretion periplasmic adaptor subunit [Aminobacter carboxidus]|uniref:Membrane fusion protein (MFP) family protein n=1 Tax=Aminobacter carboxidus TaxID=376165 RepID=A0ABR9GXR2_9HYPH|nr:HlyD family type I secretion periplasmic adaptor subunit [Aminobacter carboxidus]MBE1208473.1 HlyD family type I secretion periplasmic adaptor subunit [Aminobacter carboxidus]
MGRYWDAVKAGIAQDKGNKRPALNRDEREFQAAAIEILETPASPAARIFVGLIIVFAIGALTWSWFGRVETTASIQGKIVPVGKVQVIEPLIAGRVKAIHAKAGDHVEAGDRLIELDPAEQVAERQKLAGGLAAAEVSAARLKAILEAVANGTEARQATFAAPPSATLPTVELQLAQMRQSLSAYQAEQASFEADVAQKQVEIEQGRKTLTERQKLVSLSGQRLGIYVELEKRGVGVKSETINARQSEQDQLMAVVNESGRLAELEATVKSLAARKRERREAYLDRMTSELIEVDRTIGILRQDLAKAELFERASILASPVAGRVQQVEVATLGDVVQSGQQLMVVVPDGTALEIEAMLLNKDKGFVREGQDTRIKLEAFPFTRYGTLNGKVATVSNDAIPVGASVNAGGGGVAQGAAGPLVFPVRITLDRSSIRVDGQDVALTPGMSVTAEIKTGSRRVIEFLLDPLIEAKDEAFHER